MEFIGGMMSNYLQLNDRSKFEPEEESLARYFGEGNYQTFYRKQIVQNKLKITKDDFICGDIKTMYAAMRQLGIDYSDCDYPESLRKYLLRNVWPATMCDIRNEIYEEGHLKKPVFIKPRNNLKRFTGFVCDTIDDLSMNSYNAGNNVEIWCSDIIHFTSEYRCPIVNGKLKGCYHYNKHNPYDYIKYREQLFELVQKMADENKEGNSAYNLDVGITNRGEIALIEMTDGFSFGKYGMSDELVAEILITRWNELKEGAK